MRDEFASMLLDVEGSAQGLRWPSGDRLCRPHFGETDAPQRVCDPEIERWASELARLKMALHERRQHHRP